MPKSPVRDITDVESDFFQQNGWVLLRGLVAPELCKAMLERAAPLVASVDRRREEFENSRDRVANMRMAGTESGTLTDNKKWVEWRGAVRSAHDPTFSRAALAPAMGRNVRRLLGREQRIRVYHDIVMCKLADSASTDTPWHQDSPAFPLDRNALTVWIALDEIRADQGSLQFYSGSHKCGMLGKTSPLVDEYPQLARFHVSAPHHLQPGDATVHHGLTVHGAGANNAACERWNYAIAYFPADARYTGAPNHDCDGFNLQTGEIIEHPSFSLVLE